MCKDHSGVLVEIPTASVTFSDQTPRPNGNKRGIDACIASIVKALNDAGVGTVASCCGHGTHVGSVALADGRELLLVPDFETARQYDGPLRSVEVCPKCGGAGELHSSRCDLVFDLHCEHDPCPSCVSGVVTRKEPDERTR